MFTMFAFTILQAQNSSGVFCLTPPMSQELKAQKMLSLTNNVLDDPLTPLVLNVRITVFNDLLGNNYFSDNNLPFGENEFMEIIKNLNLDFNSKNIYFKFLGYSYHNCDYSDISDANRNYALNSMNELNENDAVNINFVNTCDGFLGTPTATASMQFYSAYVPIIGRPTIIVSMPRHNELRTYDNESVLNLATDKKHVISHEMGHVLGLDHPNTNANQPNTATITCEHVTRDDTSSFYNATSAGDLVHDTAARRNGVFPYEFYKYPQGHPYYFLDGTLKPLTGTNATQNYDCAGTYFDFVNIKFGNMMMPPIKYEFARDFMYPNQREVTFTDGQYQSMRNYIHNPLAGGDGYRVADAITNVNSLYQPFKRTPIVGTQIASTKDLGNGFAEVCRYATQSFTFQRGFNYEFPGEEGSDPITVGVDTTPFLEAPVFNCPVTIIELAPGTSNLATNTGEALTVCRLQVCTEEPFVGGIIYSTEILGSMNITVEELNAIQVKDPRLYDELMERYYYIIKKTTATGAVTQEIIYKN